MVTKIEKLYTVLMMRSIEYIVIFVTNFLKKGFRRIILNQEFILLIFVDDNNQNKIICFNYNQIYIRNLTGEYNSTNIENEDNNINCKY